MTLRVVNGRHGSFLCQDNDAYVGRSLHVYGDYSEAELGFLLQLIKPGDLMVEAGANIGALTVPLSRRLGREGRLVVFEPQRLVFQTLCANLALNGLENVFANQAAVGAVNGKTKVPFIPYGVPCNLGGVQVDADVGETVPVVSLDSFDLPRLDLLMADVEGYEEAVLRGATRQLARHKPPLYLENNQREKSASLLSFVFSLGYEAWWHLPPMFSRDNHAGRSENIFGNIISINVFCQHRDKARPIKGLRKVAGPDDWYNNR